MNERLSVVSGCDHTAVQAAAYVFCRICFCVATSRKETCMNLLELFAFCRENNVGLNVRCHRKEYDTEYYLRLRRGDEAVDQVFSESTLELLKDPDEMVSSMVEELLNELNSR